MTHKKCINLKLAYLCQKNHKAQNMNNSLIKGLYRLDFGDYRCQGYDGPQNFQAMSKVWSKDLKTTI